MVQERDDAPAQPVEDEPEEAQVAQDDPVQEERGEQVSMGEAQAQPEVQGQGSDGTPEDGHGETVGSADATIRLGPEFQVLAVPAYQGPSCTEACDRGDQLLSLAEASEAGSAPPTEALVGVLPSLVRAVVLNRAAAHEPGHRPAAREVVAGLELRMGMPSGSLAEQLVPIARAASAARLSLAGSKDGAAAEARGFCEVAGEASGGSLAGGDLGSLAGGDPGADQGSGGLVLQTMTEADVARRHALRHARRGDEEEDLFKGEEAEVEAGVGSAEEAQQVELTEEVIEPAIREDDEEWLGMEEEEEEEELAVPRFAAAPEAASGDASGVALEASSSAEQAVPQQAEPRQLEPRQLEPQQLEPGPTWVSEALLGCSEARAAAGEVAEVDAGVSPPVTLHPTLPTAIPPPPPPLAALALLLDGRGLGRREEAAALRQFNLVCRPAHAAAACRVQRACRAGAAAKPLWAVRRGVADGARAAALPGAAGAAMGSAATRGAGASAETAPMTRDASAAASEAAAGSGHASGRPPPSGDPAALEGVLREWSQAGCDLSCLLQPVALERVTGRPAAEKVPSAVAAPATAAAHGAKPVAERAVASRLDRPASPTPRPTLLRPTQAGSGGGGGGGSGGGAPSSAPRPTGTVAPAAAGLSTEARRASGEEAAAAEWSVHRTPDGKRAFFYHKPTGQRQWRRPAELQPATSTPPAPLHPPAAASPSPASSPASVATATPPAAVRSRAAAATTTPPASARAAAPAASLQPPGASASASASVSAEHARPASTAGRGAAATSGTNADAAAAKPRPRATPPAASAGGAARGTQATHGGAAEAAEAAESAARYTALMAAGHAANKRLEFVEARRCFTQAHLAQPSSITALISAANMASKLGEASEAQAEYERALALPRLPEKSRLLCVKKLAEVLTASAASEAVEAAAADDRRRRGFVQDAEGFWTRVEGFERAYSSLTAAAEAGGARVATGAPAAAVAGGSSSDGWESDDEAGRVEAAAAEAVPRFVIRPASPHDAPDLAGRAPQALIAAAAGLAPPPPPLARRWSPTLTATAGLGLASGALPAAPRLPRSAASTLAPAPRAPATVPAQAPPPSAVAAKRRPRPAPPPPLPGPPRGRAPQGAARGAAAVSSPGPAAALSDDDDML